MNIFFRCQFGSHVYGTNTPASDMDFKGLFLPEYRDIILQRPAKVKHQNTNNSNTKNTAEDVDVEYFALHHFYKLFMEGQTMCYDMLFTPKKFIIANHYIWTDIVRNKDKILNSKISAFAGYCQSQAAKYSLKGSNLSAYRMAVNFFKEHEPHARVGSLPLDELIARAAKESLYTERNEPLIKIVTIPHRVTKQPEEYLQVGPKTKVPFTAMCKLAASIFFQQFEKYGERAKQAETNKGVDWKALMHAVRVCEEARELLLTGNITFPRPEAEFLLKIRKGELPFKEVADHIVQGLDSLNDAKLKTVLPPEPDRKWIEDFIFETYRGSG